MDYFSTVVDGATQKARVAYNDVFSRAEQLAPTHRASIQSLLEQQARLKATATFQIELALGKAMVQVSTRAEAFRHGEPFPPFDFPSRIFPCPPLVLTNRSLCLNSLLIPATPVMCVFFTSTSFGCDEHDIG